jgi:hypothetical protein
MQNPPLAVDQVINPSVSVVAKIIAHTHKSFAERFPRPVPECRNRSADRIPSGVIDGGICDTLSDGQCRLAWGHSQT